MVATITRTETIIIGQCYKCGISFGMPEVFDRERREDKDVFYCPNGHGQIYGPSEADRLKLDLAKVNSELGQQKHRNEQLSAKIDTERKNREEVEKSLSATKGVVTRLKNRVKNGVCPCCTRSFSNLQQHMKKQHPEFASSLSDAT